MILVSTTNSLGHTTHRLEMNDEELRLLRFDMSMALAFSQYDRYEIFDDVLTVTEYT